MNNKPNLYYVGSLDMTEFYKEGIKTKRVSIKDVERALDKAEIWYLDTETYASKDLFNPLTIRKKWLSEKREQKIRENRKQQKLTQTDENSADTYVEKRRSEIVFNTKITTIRLFQCYADGKVYIVDTYTSSIDNIIAMLPEKKVGVQNGKYDLEIFHAQYGVRPKEVFDTMLGDRMIGLASVDSKKYPYYFKSNLGVIVKRWLGITIDKSHGHKDWGDVLDSEMILYAYYDVVYMEEIIDLMISDLNFNSVNKRSGVNYFKGLEDAVAILEMKFLLVLCRIETAGIPVDIQALNKAKAEAEVELQQPLKELEEVGLNPNSPKQVPLFFAERGVLIPDAQENTLKAKEHEHPLITPLLKAKKLLTKISDIDSYLNALEGGKIHPNFWQIRAPTGRMSSTNPNTQKIPRSIKDHIYYDLPNRGIAKCDYPAIEVRIQAVISGDENLKQVFKDKKDPYKATVASMLDIPIDEVTKDLRQKGKAIVLGFEYGMGISSYIDYAKYTFGIEVTKTQAMEDRNKFFSLYPTLKFYLASNGEVLNFHNFMISSTLLGRRMFIQNYTDAQNYPSQGSGADMIKMASVMFYAKIDEEGLDADIINLIHDEIVIDRAKKDAKRVDSLLKECMERSANYLMPEFLTECEVE